MKKRLAVIDSSPMTCTYGGVAPFLRNMDNELRKEYDVEYFYIPENWSKTRIIPGRFKIMYYLWTQRKRLRKFDFALTHVPEGAYVVSFFGIPYAHIFHGNDNPMTQSRYRFGIYFKFLFDIMIRRVEKTASFKYTVGPVIKDRKKLLNPINHNVEEKPYNERHGFIFAGRLEVIKNIDRLIQIYSKIPQNIKEENHFYIAGYGTQEQNLRHLVDKLGLNEYVHFLGNLANEKLIEEDSSKRILIMDSTQEGLPSAIAEALTVGVPVISTNPGDIGLVLKNDYNGFIFPLKFRDEDYIKAIETILGDYDRFAKAAKESSKIFNASVITKGVIADIKAVLNKEK